MKTICAFLMVLSPVIYAGQVSIVKVAVECPHSCTFAVTLQHADQGWGHYANQWDVVTIDGRLLKSRVLAHPHDHEQPFTRSLAGVVVPQGMKQVKIRARDSKHGYSPHEVIVDIPGRD